MSSHPDLPSVQAAKAANAVLRAPEPQQPEPHQPEHALAAALALCEALRAKYHDLYHHAPVSYLTVLPQGEIVETNLAAEKLFGLSANALVGRDVRSLFGEGGARDVGALFNRLQGSVCDVFAYEVLLNTQPIPRYVNIQARVYQDPVLLESRVSVMLMDVSALKSAKEDVCRAISGFGPLI